MIRPIPFDGETGQRESEEGRPTVSKKNHGVPTPSKIVRKKSHPCPNDGNGKPTQSRLVCFKCHRPHESGYENRKPRGQAIHTVKKVEGVRDPDDPEQCQHDVRNIADWTTWKQRQHLARGNDDPGCHKLGDQLRRGRQFPNVINDTINSSDPAARVAIIQSGRIEFINTEPRNPR